MSEAMHAVDIEQIGQEVRKELRRRLASPGAILVPSPRADESDYLASELAALRATADIYDAVMPSGRRLLVPFLTAVKRAARRLLTPSLARQVSYNLANIRLLEGLHEYYDSLARHQAGVIRELGEAQARGFAALREQLDGLARLPEELSGHARTLDGIRLEITSLTQGQLGLRAELLAAQEAALRHMRERITDVERRLRRVLRTATAAEAPPVSASVRADERDRDFDYWAFEARFRGTEADIQGRQRVYVEHFRGATDVVDLGCGRGEFLDLLREAGIRARGVDLDPEMVLACEEKGLEVTRADAFAYLEGRPDASLGGIFAAQLIEHVDPRHLISLVRLCHAKLLPGGVLLLETINPGCLTVFAESFYMDPSHVRPIHPEALRFIFEAAGFVDTAVTFSSPVDVAARIPEVRELPEEFNRAIRRLNDLLYGCQDYAVVGRKEAAPPPR